MLRWDPSVPSGSSVAIAWSDSLFAKQPQMFELASCLMIIANLSDIPTESVFRVPEHHSPMVKKLAWQNATQNPCKRRTNTLTNEQLLVNICCQFSIGLEPATSLHMDNYRHVTTRPTFGNIELEQEICLPCPFLCIIWTRPNLFWTAGPI